MRVFKDTGKVEQLGSGMDRILKAYDRSIFQIMSSLLIVTFPFVESYTAPVDQDVVQVTGQVIGQVAGQDERICAIVEFCNTPRTRKEIQEFVGIASREHFNNAYLSPLLVSEQLRMTIPDKPNSSNQNNMLSETIELRFAKRSNAPLPEFH